MDFTTILLIIINFAGSLAVFLFAMKMMSEGLQKVAEDRATVWLWPAECRRNPSLRRIAPA